MLELSTLNKQFLYNEYYVDKNENTFPLTHAVLLPAIDEKQIILEIKSILGIVQ